MKRILRLILIVPLLLLLALFAGTNRKPVTLGLWPTDYAVTMPLALTVLGTAGLAFLIGGMLVWFSAFRVRRQLRRADENIRLLEEQIRALRAQPPSNPALPPPTA
jgi:uncharacterized integral membrane protein